MISVAIRRRLCRRHSSFHALAQRMGGKQGQKATLESAARRFLRSKLPILSLGTKSESRQTTNKDFRKTLRLHLIHLHLFLAPRRVGSEVLILAELTAANALKLC